MAKLTLKSAASPRWGDAEKTHIILECEFVELAIGPMRYMAAPFDPEPHGREIFECAKAGDFGPVLPCITPAQPQPSIPATQSGPKKKRGGGRKKKST